MKRTEMIRECCVRAARDLEEIEELQDGDRYTPTEIVDMVLNQYSGTFGVLFAIVEALSQDIEKIEEQLDKRVKVQ